MRELDWYFDFISPFSYLQCERLDAFGPDLELHFRPLLFAGLLNHWENKGPAEIAPKRQWTFEHVAWLAHKHGIPMRLPSVHPFNPLPLLRLCIALGSTREVVQRLFRFVWCEGHLPTDGAAWEALLRELDATPAMLEDAAVKQQLRENGERAIAAGVFGVPSAVVDGRVFWGFDATDMLNAWLKRDPFFESGLFHSARTLPQGLQRQKK